MYLTIIEQPVSMCIFFVHTCRSRLLPAISLEHVLRDGDRVSIYPVFERLDIEGVTNLEDRPLRILRFLAEKDLVDVADRLSALGFDVLCRFGLGTEEAMEISTRERRILLTTRKDVVLSGKITHGLYIGPGGVEDQIRKIKENLCL